MRLGAASKKPARHFEVSPVCVCPRTVQATASPTRSREIECTRRRHWVRRFFGIPLRPLRSELHPNPDAGREIVGSKNPCLSDRRRKEPRRSRRAALGGRSYRPLSPLPSLDQGTAGEISVPPFHTAPPRSARESRRFERRFELPCRLSAGVSA